MRDLFRLARWGIALLPPPGKLSVIEVSDLARLLLALVDGRSNRRLLEADDGKPGGWTHDEFANAIGRAVGQRVMPMALPQPFLRLVARGDRLVRGARARLTPARGAYFCPPAVNIDPENAPPTGTTSCRERV